MHREALSLQHSIMFVLRQVIILHIDMYKYDEMMLMVQNTEIEFIS